MSIKLVQHCIGISYTQCCPNTSERTLHKKVTGAMLCQTTQSSFRRKITIWNVVLICLSQHYTRKIPVQCWPILHKQVAQKKSESLPGSVWANIAQGDYLCNVGPWLTDNFYEENNLYNVASTMLRQYYIGILSVPCCPNTSEENYLYNVGTERTAIILKENNLHNFVLLCLGQDCTKQ